MDGDPDIPSPEMAVIPRNVHRMSVVQPEEVAGISPTDSDRVWFPAGVRLGPAQENLDRHDPFGGSL